jgi:predicted transcriptional regulator
MRDKRTDAEPKEAGEEAEDMMVLLTLLEQGDHWPWSVDELIRDRGDGDNVAVEDAIHRLERGGMVRRTKENLVFPTRAAIYRASLREL